MPATRTAPTTTARQTDAALVIDPMDLPDGGRLLFFVTKKSYYRTTLQDRDDFCESWYVERQRDDGSYAPGYTVALPCNGNTGVPSCTCPGYRYSNDYSCRHTLALAALTGTEE